MARNREIRIKLSEDEFQKIERKAVAMGLPISTYLRVVGIQSNPKRQVE